MSAVNPPSPAPVSHVDPEQAVRLLEMELARARAVRLAREGGGVAGRRTVLHAVCLLFLLALVAGGLFAFWRAQELRQEVRRAVPAPAPASAPAKRP